MSEIFNAVKKGKNQSEFARLLSIPRSTIKSVIKNLMNIGLWRTGKVEVGQKCSLIEMLTYFREL